MMAPLKVMTFNILYATARNPAGDWTARRPLVAKVIGDYAPDIIGFQELTELQLAEVSIDLPEYSIVAGPMSGPRRVEVWARTLSPALAALGIGVLRSRGNGSKTRQAISNVLLAGAALPLMGTLGSRLMNGPGVSDGESCALFYRTSRLRVVEQSAFWLSAQPQRAGSVLLGSWLPRVVNRVRFEQRESSEQITVYNTHIDYLPWAARRSGKLIRAQMERAWDGSPQILLGDFNATPDKTVLRDLLSDNSWQRGPALRDAWSTAGHRNGPEFTYHAGRGQGLSRIDYLLFRPYLPVAKITTVTDHDGSTYPSDHFPVMAEFG